jgi:hypothetical protein
MLWYNASLGASFTKIICLTIVDSWNIKVLCDKGASLVSTYLRRGQEGWMTPHGAAPFIFSLGSTAVKQESQLRSPVPPSPWVVVVFGTVGVIGLALLIAICL